MICSRIIEFRVSEPEKPTPATKCVAHDDNNNNGNNGENNLWLTKNSEIQQQMHAHTNRIKSNAI